MHKLLIATITSSLLVLTGSIAGAQPARARMADTPIRGEASLGSVIFATLKEGGALDVLSLKDDWYRVLVPDALGTPRVGYVLTHLVEIIDAGGSPQSILVPLASRDLPSLNASARAVPPVDQGPLIAPSLAQLSLQRIQATERELALKAEVDALQAELNAIQNGQPARPIRPGQTPRPAAPYTQAREGFWFNGSFGFGSLGCGGCNGGTVSGASGGASVGWTFTDRLLLGVGTAGYSRFVDGTLLNVGTLDARLRFYPVRTYGVFLTGGLGLGRISQGLVTETGVGTVFGGVVLA